MNIRQEIYHVRRFADWAAVILTTYIEVEYAKRGKLYCRCSCSYHDEQGELANPDKGSERSEVRTFPYQRFHDRLYPCAQRIEPDIKIAISYATFIDSTKGKELALTD